MDVLTKEFQFSKQNYIYLTDECFNDVIHIMRKLITALDIGESLEYEEIYKVLVLCTRMVRKNSGANLAS